MLRGRGAVVVAFVLGLVVATAGTATATRLITGKQIKDGSVALRDLTPGVRNLVKKAGTPGPPGPRGTRGEPGPSSGPAGGDLSGTYPDPTLRRPAAVVLREQPGPSCVTTFDILCGDGTNGWTRAGGAASFALPAYFAEPGGFVQFQGAVQQVGAGFGSGLLFYLPPGRRPGGTLRFPVVSFDHPEEVGHVRVGDNGEVSLIGFPTSNAGDRFDMSAVRFRVADPQG